MDGSKESGVKSEELEESWSGRVSREKRKSANGLGETWRKLEAQNPKFETNPKKSKIVSDSC